MILRCATFNVLADAYLSYGDYRHVAPELLKPGARLSHTIKLIHNLRADVIGLQEAEDPLYESFSPKNWQTFWSPKTDDDSPDGCLMLVKNGIETKGFKTFEYDDGSGYVMQSLTIGGCTFANTHLKWEQPWRNSQATAFFERLGSGPAVILGDFNDRPGEPVHELAAKAGFRNVWGEEPTALVGKERAAIDLLATRGLQAKRVGPLASIDGIPTVACPSDHIPVVADIVLP